MISILRDLENVLKNEQDDKDTYYKDRPFKHYPSSASCVKPDGSVAGACLRQLYWKATKEPVTNPWRLAGVLQRGFGDAIHTWLFGKLKGLPHLNLVVEAAGKLKVDELSREVSYRMDGLVNIEGKSGGCELKTTQARSIDKMAEEGGPKDAHILQVFDYMAANPAMVFFSLIYVARDSGMHVEYLIERDGKDFWLTQVFPTQGQRMLITTLSVAAVTARRKELEMAVDNKALPPRDFSVFLNKDGDVQYMRQKAGEKYKSDWQCLYCDYQKKCWGSPDAKTFEKRI